MLEDKYGARPADITWVGGGYEQPGRIEKITLNLPSDVRIEQAPEGATISGLLADGAIDAVIGPRAPSCFGRHPQVGWLFADPAAAAAEWFRKTGILPIMHLLGIRRTLVEQHPWLPAAAMKAFEQAKARAVALEEMFHPSTHETHRLCPPVLPRSRHDRHTWSSATRRATTIGCSTSARQ